LKLYRTPGTRQLKEGRGPTEQESKYLIVKMHTSGILKTEQSFPNKVIDKVLNFTIKALFAWENNDCWERPLIQ